MTHVVDTSALMAVLLDERGADQVFAPDRLLHLSIVNLAELYTKVVERGGAVGDVDDFISPRPIRIRAFRESHAVEQALLRPSTRDHGLSFGDRACLALARTASLPVLTADSKWLGLDLGVELLMIR